MQWHRRRPNRHLNSLSFQSLVCSLCLVSSPRFDSGPKQFARLERSGTARRSDAISSPSLNVENCLLHTEQKKGLTRCRASPFIPAISGSTRREAEIPPAKPFRL